MAIHINSSVIDRLEKADPDRIRAARLADVDQRDQLLALYAFHAELAKIPELVSEPMIGQIRYQWWRDCLEEIYSGGPVRQHEVSGPLAEMVSQTELSRFHLDQIINGRERDLDPRPFRSIEDAQDYTEATSGALLTAALVMLGAEPRKNAGRAWGLTGLARGYRYYADTMLKAVTFEQIVASAKLAYNDASAPIPDPALPAIAYVALVPGYLKRMEKSGYDPRRHAPIYAPFSKQVRQLGAVVRGRL